MSVLLDDEWDEYDKEYDREPWPQPELPFDWVPPQVITPEGIESPES